jgi:GPH family glycoside/pentoside/hexuronide:cation symporter
MNPPEQDIRTAVKPSRGIISTPRKVLFGFGCGMDYLAGTLVSGVLWMPYFNLGLGLSPVALGLISTVLQVWSAALAPVAGYFSDNLDTRWGRRRPVIIVAALFTAVLFPMLWHLPNLGSEALNLAYFFVIGIVFSSAYTTWSAAYYALQLEVTPDYDERTSIAAWMGIFSKVAQLLGGWVLALVTSNYFADPVTGKPDLVHGTQVISWGIALAIFLTGALPALVIRERPGLAQAAGEKGSRESLWQSMCECAGCVPLWYLVGISFFLLMGSMSVINLWQYLNIYLVNGGDLSFATVVSGWRSTAIFGIAIGCVPLWMWLSARYDKRIVAVTLMVMGLIGHALNYVFILQGRPYLQLAPTLFEAAAVSAIWIFIPSMRADIADFDELKTGRRREGAINAFSSWFNKLAFTFSASIGGFALSWTGFSAQAAQQAPGVLHHLKITYVLITLVFWSIALVLLWYYPLDRKRMAELVAQLEARRGKR